MCVCLQLLNNNNNNNDRQQQTQPLGCGGQRLSAIAGRHNIDCVVVVAAAAAAAMTTATASELVGLQ